jgi:hypothetical protein
LLVKIFRVFWGGYIADSQKLNNLKYTQMRLPKFIQISTHPNHGFGLIKGTTRKVGEVFPSAQLCVFRRDNKQLIWETRSKSNGTYVLRNIAKGLECFVVAFDPNNQYNAVISDKVVAK